MAIVDAKSQPLDKSLPPTPQLVDRIRLLMRVAKGDFSALEELLSRFGDTSRLKIPGDDLIIAAFHPQDVRRILQSHNRNYVKGDRYHQLEWFLGRGLVNTEGKQWEQQRRQVGDLFTNRRVEAFVPRMGQFVEQMIERFSGMESPVIDVKPEIARLSMQIAADIFLDLPLNDRMEKMREGIEQGLILVVQRTFALLSLPMWVPLQSHRKLLRIRREFNEVIDDVIQRHQAGRSDKETFINRLFQGDGDRSLPLGEVRDQLKTILLVGHETSSSAISWALYAIAKNQQEQKNLREEIMAVCKEGPPTLDQLNRSHYLDLVTHECLRMFPSIPLLLRKAVEDDSLGGYFVPQGATTLISAWATHRHPEFWKEPEKFIPERFAGFENERDSRLAGAYFPFGYGPRHCIGEYLSLLEIKITLAMLVRHFQITVKKGFVPRGRSYVSLQSTNGIWLQFEKVVP